MATILINTTIKLSYAGSARSPTQLNPIQNYSFVNFADSPSFTLFEEKAIEEKLHLTFQNLQSFQFIKSESLSIKVCPDERFIKIGIILRPLDAHEYTNQKTRGMNLKMTSEIMGIILWTYLIWCIWTESTNIQFLSSTCSFTYRDDHWKHQNTPPNIIGHTKYENWMFIKAKTNWYIGSLCFLDGFVT
eukprot:392313_1